MSQIILDFGSGNSCQNKLGIVKKMYDELKKVDSGKHQVIVKWQLFKEAGQNISLQRDVFNYAYEYGRKLGYEVTSSVFDKESLDFLLQYEIPFVKIANRRDLDWLIGEVPRKVPVYVSYGSIVEPIYSPHSNTIIPLACISSYPASIEAYEKVYYGVNGGFMLIAGISDHTTDFALWKEYDPEIIEWHYVLEHDPKNLDGGLFARTPTMLREVL